MGEQSVFTFLLYVSYMFPGQSCLAGSHRIQIIPIGSGSNVTSTKEGSITKSRKTRKINYHSEIMNPLNPLDLFSQTSTYQKGK